MMLNTVVILNLALVLTHQVDGAYWHEWEMFQLPGLIGGIIPQVLRRIFSVN